MLHILTMAVRQIMHTEAQQDYLSKRRKLGYYLGFPRFVFWKKNLWTLFSLHNKEMQIIFFLVHAFKRMYSHMISNRF